MRLEPGDVAVVVLQTPREKLLALVHQIDPAGIFVRSIDLGYFDDWCRSIAADEAHLKMSDNFFPMWRVERITRDEPGGDIPSMAEQFEQRTGLRLKQQ